MKKVKYFFSKISHRKKEDPTPLHMHHPDATTRPISYRIPESLRLYAADFPIRVQECLTSTEMDKYNASALDAEVLGILHLAQNDLQTQRDRNLDTISCIRQRNDATILGIKSEIEELDQKIHDIDIALQNL